MTNDTLHGYTYDAEGNITKVDNGSTATYTYDALNQRVKTVVGTATTEFVFTGAPGDRSLSTGLNANGQRVSEWNASTHGELKGHYYWGSKPGVPADRSSSVGWKPGVPADRSSSVGWKPVAYYDTIGTHFQHQDCPGSPATGLRRWGGSLGTERMRTSSNGSVEGTYTSFPWGDSEVPTGTDTDANHFATLDHDTESNTDHAEFRQYSNTQGRFLSPDPYDGSYDPTNPQSFNRYVYAMNNPLSNIDPSGRDCIYDNGNGSFTTEYGDCASTSDGGYYVDCDGCLNGATVTGIIQNQNPNIVDLAAYTTSAGLYDVNGNLLDPTASVSVNANPPQLAVAGMSVGGSAPGGSGGGGGALNNAPGRAIPPSPHNNNNQTFTQCMGGELINNFLGSSDNAGVTVAVHVAAIAARQAAGGLLPGPGWVYTGAAALWDVAQVGKSYVS